MRSYAAATWATMEAVHHLMLEVIVVEVNVLLASKHIFTNSVEVNLHNMLGKKIYFYQPQDEKPENERERLDPDHWYKEFLSRVQEKFC